MREEENRMPKADRIIRIEHRLKQSTEDGLDEQFKEQLAKLKQERDEANSIIALNAEAELRKEAEQFETEKNQFLDLVQDESKRQELEEKFNYIDDLGEIDVDQFERAKDRLSDAKLWSGWIAQGIEQSGGRITGIGKPSGKAVIRREPYSSGDKSVDDAKQYIDELYAIKRNPSKTEDEKMQADKLLDELFMSVIKGINVAKRRTGRGLGNYQINECPSCHQLIQSPLGVPFNSCPSCGWKLYSNQYKR